MHSGNGKAPAFPVNHPTLKDRRPRPFPNQSQPIRVLIIDDHAVIRAALRMFLDSQPGVMVVGEGSGSVDGLAMTLLEHPDIILLDLDLGRCNGLDLLPQLHIAAPEAHVVVLTGVRDLDMHRRAVRLGAMGLVHKEKAAEALLDAIVKVHAGEVWADGLLLASVLTEMTRPWSHHPPNPEEIKIRTLTPRERELIAMIGQGLKNQTIADRLCISEATVRHHLTSIYSKLSVGDRLELAIYAYRHGLASLLA